MTINGHFCIFNYVLIMVEVKAVTTVVMALPLISQEINNSNRIAFPDQCPFYNQHWLPFSF